MEITSEELFPLVVFIGQLLGKPKLLFILGLDKVISNMAKMMLTFSFKYSLQDLMIDDSTEEKFIKGIVGSLHMYMMSDNVFREFSEKILSPLSWKQKLQVYQNIFIFNLTRNYRISTVEEIDKSVYGIPDPEDLTILTFTSVHEFMHEAFRHKRYMAIASCIGTTPEGYITRQRCIDFSRAYFEYAKNNNIQSTEEQWMDEESLKDSVLYIEVYENICYLDRMLSATS